MSHILIKIETDNAAFEDDPGHEASEILKDLSNRIKVINWHYNWEFYLKDTNGNRVGQCEFVEDEKTVPEKTDWNHSNDW